MVIVRLGGDTKHIHSEEDEVHDSGVCDKRALLIVSLRALAA